MSYNYIFDGILLVKDTLSIKKLSSLSNYRKQDSIRRILSKSKVNVNLKLISFV